MTAALIVELITALGPVALDLIPKLTALWGSTTPLTLEQVNDLCGPAKTSYDAYRSAAKASVTPAQ